MEQIGQLEKEPPKDTPRIVKKDLVKKRRRRLPSMDRMRAELAGQLRESLRTTEEKMNNPELTLAERHHWTQAHTYTAQVLNTILRDLQMREWERRLKVIEEASKNKHVSFC